MKKFRVVQVGTGPMVHSEHAMRTMRRRNDLFDVLGLVEENDSRYNEIKDHPTYRGLRRLTWEEAVRLRPEGVLIETDEHQLVVNAIRSLEAGFPTYMDKPGSEESANFHLMCHIAETKKLPLVLGYMYRTNPAILYALEMKRSGKFGRIFSVEAQMNNCGDAGYLKNIVTRFKGGMMYYLGCHMIDLVVQFCGFPDEIVPFNSKTGAHGIDCADYGFCVLRYPNGVSFAKTTCSELNGINRRSVVICGEKATLEIRPIEVPRKDGSDDSICYLTDNNDTPYGDGRKEIKFPPHWRYDLLLEQFVSCARGEMQVPFSPEYEAKLHDLILQACGIDAE